MDATGKTQHDIDTVIEAARQLKKLAAKEKRVSYRRTVSKLEVHKTIIHEMHNKGCSLGEIQIALRSVLKPHRSCSRSTILRFLDKPENDLTSLSD